MQAAQLAERHYQRGGVHKIAGRLTAAEAEFRAALAVDPSRLDVRYSLGAVLLAAGLYAEGYALYEHRHDIASFNNRKPALPFPEWRGGDVVGKKILIWPEQGFGDQIQAARFAPILKDRGADVTLMCAPALASLFRTLGVNVVAASGTVEFPDPDGWVMCESIAGRFGCTPETLPSDPYFHIPARPRQGPLSVGVATKGDPRHHNDTYRSLSDPDAARLRALPAEVVSLHPQDSGAKNFLETAEIIAGLDLVISVDTSVAHLAGAMGKEAWVMIPAFNTDWRWMRDRTDSPWYPSLRLFRQSHAGDWSNVLDLIEADLARRVSPTRAF